MAIHQHRPTEGRSNWKNLFYLVKSLAKKKKKSTKVKLSYNTEQIFKFGI